MFLHHDDSPVDEPIDNLYDERIDLLQGFRRPALPSNLTNPPHLPSQSSLEMNLIIFKAINIQTEPNISKSIYHYIWIID